MQDHPVQEFLRSVAFGWDPSPSELDETAQSIADNLTENSMRFPSIRRRLADTAKSIARYREAGQFLLARQVAREEGAELAEKLSDYVAPNNDPLRNEMDPAVLADAAYRDR